MKLALVALEKKSADEGIILTEAQAQTLKRKKTDDEACEEIVIHPPGYLGNKDTFNIGTIKDVGRIYQQTYVLTGQNGLPKSSIRQRRPLLPQICSMTVFSLSLRKKKWG